MKTSRNTPAVPPLMWLEDKTVHAGARSSDAKPCEQGLSSSQSSPVRSHLALCSLSLPDILEHLENPGNSVASPHATSTRAVHPKFDRTSTSINLRGGPSGSLVSKPKFPSKPTTSLMVSPKHAILSRYPWHIHWELLRNSDLIKRHNVKFG